MENKELPKLTLLQLSSYVADLLLASEGDFETIKAKPLRNTWHLFYFSITAYVLCILITPLVFDLYNSSSAALFWRSANLVVWFYFLFLACILAYQHYNFLLKTGKDLRFKNILFFFFLGLLVFANLYFLLYFIKPGLFLYTAVPVQPAAVLVHLTLKNNFLLKMDFLTYSGCTMFTLDYPRIRSGSTLISALNLLEVVYGLALVSFFIATFVQKSDSRKRHPNAEQVVAPDAQNDAHRT